MLERMSVVVKLWLAFVGLVLVVLLPPGLTLNRMLVEFYQSQVTDPLVFHTERISEMVAHGPDMLVMAPMMGQMAGAEVYAVDDVGRPLRFPGAAATKPPAQVVERALGGQSLVVRGRGPDGQILLMAAAPVPGRDRPAGAVVLLAPAAPLEKALGTARRVLVLAVIGTALLAGGLALLLSRTLVRPLVHMEQATRAMARGQFASRVDIQGSDEIGRLGQAVNALAADLQRFEQTRREFLANVAHELRTPLSYVRGYSQALAEGVVTNEEDRVRYLKIIQEEAARLGGLVEELMDLAAMEEGGVLTLSTAPLDLAVPVTQAVANLQPDAREKGVALKAELPPELPSVQADGSRVQQVLLNLLDNALRHTPPGGAVQVTAEIDLSPLDGRPGDQRGHEAGHGTVHEADHRAARSGELRGADGAAPERKWVRVRVRDTGPGIPPEELDAIWDRFHKVDRSRAAGGRGLGLSIVRSIVRAHGGEVGAESTPGSGSLFWFTLPVAP